jgi:uncharacterized protein YbcI
VVKYLRVVRHVGFFCRSCDRGWDHRRLDYLDTSAPTLAQQIARAAIALHQEMTGHSPQAAAVLMNEVTLTVTLHGALSAAEQALAKSAEGAAKVQEFHNKLFNNSGERLRLEIQRITGVEVCEAMAEIETTTGTVVQNFTFGLVVPVFDLPQLVPADAWSGVSPVGCS